MREEKKKRGVRDRKWRKKLIINNSLIIISTNFFLNNFRYIVISLEKVSNKPMINKTLFDIINPNLKYVYI